MPIKTCLIVEGLELQLESVDGVSYWFKVVGALTKNQAAVFGRFETWSEQDQTFKLVTALDEDQDMAWFVGEVALQLRQWFEVVNQIVVDHPLTANVTNQRLADMSFPRLKTECGTVFSAKTMLETPFWLRWVESDFDGTF